MKDEFFGLYRGVVKDNDDSTQLHPHRGCVKVDVPSVYGEKVPIEDLPWAEPSFPTGGGQLAEGASYGLLAIPPIGSTVWIAFERGDPNDPVWLGTWYGEKDATPELPDEALTAAGTNVRYPDIWLLRDPSSKTGMYLRFVRDEFVELVSVKDETFVRINRDGSIEVRAKDGDVDVESKEGSVTLISGEVDDDPDLDTQQKIELDFDNRRVTIEAKDLNIQATNITLTATNDIRFRAAEGTYNSSRKASGFEGHGG